MPGIRLLILSITVRASRAWTFERAWDRYQLPKPFARVEIVRGTSIPVADQEVGRAREELQRRLTSLQAA